jgi:hypothetical protein
MDYYGLRTVMLRTVTRSSLDRTDLTGLYLWLHDTLYWLKSTKRKAVSPASF